MTPLSLEVSPTFYHDDRLGILIPDVNVVFEELPLSEQEDILIRWEVIRAQIPDQIMKFEQIVEDLLQRVHEEDDWDRIALHFTRISDYASRINELNTWRRVDPSIHPSPLDETRAERQDWEK